MDDTTRIALEDGQFLVVRRDDETNQTHLIVEDATGREVQHLIMDEREAQEFALALAEARVDASDLTPEQIIYGRESGNGSVN